MKLLYAAIPRRVSELIVNRWGLLKILDGGRSRAVSSLATVLKGEVWDGTQLMRRARE